jgi:hypothetical protein
MDAQIEVQLKSKEEKNILTGILLLKNFTLKPRVFPKWILLPEYSLPLNDDKS